MKKTFKSKNEEDKNQVREYLNDITNFRQQNGISIFIIVLGFAAIIVFQVFDIAANILKTLLPLIYIVVIGGFVILIINLIFTKKILFDLNVQVRSHYHKLTHEYIDQIIKEFKTTRDISVQFESSIEKIDNAILKEQNSIYSIINKLENKENPNLTEE